MITKLSQTKGSSGLEHVHSQSLRLREAGTKSRTTPNDILKGEQGNVIGNADTVPVSVGINADCHQHE